MTSSSWKSPHEWSEEEIHEYVLKTTGQDIIKPRGYQVLIMLWKPSTVTEGGLSLAENTTKRQMLQSSVGLVLRMGKDAFTDEGRYPTGPWVTYGEWAIFRGNERQQVQVGSDIRLAFINDDRFLGTTDDPSITTTSFDLEFEYAGM